MLTTILVEQRSLAGSKTATTFVPDTDTPISAACLPSKHLWLRQLLFSPDNRTYRISGGINFRHRWHRKHFNSGPITISVAKPSQFPSLASIFASSSNETSIHLRVIFKRNELWIVSASGHWTKHRAFDGTQLCSFNPSKAPAFPVDCSEQHCRTLCH